MDEHRRCHVSHLHPVYEGALTEAELLYLGATATYTDPQASSKSMRAISANKVELDTQNKAPKFPDQDMETDGDQLDQTRKVDEETETETAGESWVPRLTATDDNIDDLLTYTLGGGDAALFSIVRTSGHIMVGSGTKLDYETKDTYTVTVTATDSYQASATITVTIKVNNVDEAARDHEGPRRKRCPRVRFRQDQQNGGGEHGCRRIHRHHGGGKRR